jgi:ferredoxin
VHRSLNVPLRIRIDHSLCRGAQACVRRAPKTFALGENRKSRAAEPAPDDEQTIREAAAVCPFFAIEVRETKAPAHGGADSRT